MTFTSDQVALISQTSALVLLLAVVELRRRFGRRAPNLLRYALRVTPIVALAVVIVFAPIYRTPIEGSDAWRLLSLYVLGVVPVVLQVLFDFAGQLMAASSEDA